MAGESLSFDIVGHDRASGSFRSAAAAASDMGGKMDLAAKSAYLLQESLNKQRKAADSSVGATLTLAKADKILADAEHVLADGALEADFALKREAEAAKKSGRAAVEAAAENRTLADSLRKVADSSFFKPSGLGIAAALSPALIPLAGGIAGAVGAIGVSFGAAAIGAGLFGLAAKSVLSSIGTNEAKLQALSLRLAAATTPAAKKSAQNAITALTSSWSKGYLNLIELYKNFQKQWQGISQAIAVPALTTWLGALTKGLPLLKTAVKPVADVFQLWGQILKDNFASPAIMAHLQGMAAAFGKFSASQLTLVGGAIADIALGVFHLGKDLASSGANFSAAGIWFNNMGAGFLSWSKSAKARADVQGFMHYLHTEGPVVRNILSDLGTILPGIFAGASATGQLELGAISGFLGLIAGLPKGWQKPLTEAAGAILLLSKTGVLSTGLKLTFPKADAGKGALAASLGMRLVAGAFIVPAAVMIIGTIIPKDTSKQAAADFKNQPGIIVKVSDFLHTQGLGAWVDQYFSHPIRKWALTTLPDTLDTAASKVGVFLTKTIPTDALKMAFSITGTFAKLPGPLGAPFKKAHAAIGSELSQIQFKAAQTARQINLDWQGLHGKKVALTFGLNLPAGVSFPSRHIKGHAAGTPGAAPGWAWVGEKGPELMKFKGGEQVIPNHMATRLGGYAAGTVGDFTGNFPSSGMIGAAASAMQGAISSVSAAVKGLLHINRSMFTFAGSMGDSGARTHSAAVAQAFAASLMSMYGWSQSQMGSLIPLWNQESGWNAYAVNPSSGAYGIPQSLGHGHPYNLGDYKNQVIWGLNYIKQRPGYGSPAAAWAHEQQFNWYGNGLDAIFRKPTLIGVGERGPEHVHVGRPGSSGTHVVLEVRARHGATDLDRAIVAIIQKFVIVSGGGDVQAALGQKA